MVLPATKTITVDADECINISNREQVSNSSETTELHREQYKNKREGTPLASKTLTTQTTKNNVLSNSANAKRKRTSIEPLQKISKQSKRSKVSEPFSDLEFSDLSKETTFLGQIVGEAVHRLAIRRGWDTCMSQVEHEIFEKLNCTAEKVNEEHDNYSFSKHHSFFPSLSANDQGNEILDDETIQAISRSNTTLHDFQKDLQLETIKATLPMDWQLLIPFRKKEALGDSEIKSLPSSKPLPDANNMIVDVISKFSKYCVWRLGYQHTQLFGTRKTNSPFFTGKANCKFAGCPHSVEYHIPSCKSDYMVLSFSGKIFHKKGSLAARRIRGDKRSNLKRHFQDDRSALPSEKRREDLIKIDPEAFASGNLTGAATSNETCQQIASTARKEADSLTKLSRDVISLQSKLAERDEKEAINLGHTFRGEYGFIQRSTVSEKEISIRAKIWRWVRNAGEECDESTLDDKNVEHVVKKKGNTESTSKLHAFWKQKLEKVIRGGVEPLLHARLFSLVKR